MCDFSEYVDLIAYTFTADLLFILVHNNAALFSD